jgi:hypothetical protein
VTTVKEEVPGFIHPKSRRIRWVPTERLDFLWLAILFAIYMLIAIWVNSTSLSWLSSLVGLPILMFAIVSMYQPESSKYNERLYQIVITNWKNFVLTTLKKGEVYRSEESVKTELRLRAQLIEAGRQETARTGKKTDVIDFTVNELPADIIAGFTVGDEEKRRLSKVFPLEVRGLKVKDDETIGLIYNETKRTYSIVFKADGSGIRDSSRLSQYHTMRQFAALITKTTAIAGLRGLKLSMGIRNRPQDQWLIPETALLVSDPGVVMPSAIRLGKDPADYTQDDLMDIALHKLQNSFAELGVQSYSVDMMVVITVNENEALRLAFKSQEMKERDFRRLPIMKILNTVLPALKKLVGGDIEVLDLHGAERYLRQARDVATLFDFYGNDQLRRVLARERTLSGDTRQLSDAQHYDYLPLSHIVSSRTGINVDGTFASIMDLTTFPEGETSVHDMPYLSDAESTWSSFSIIGESVRSGMEYLLTNNLTGIVSELKDKVGIISDDARSQRKANEQFDRLAEMDNAGVSQNFIVRFATLDISEDDLEEQFALDIDRFSGLGLGPVAVTQPSQQWLKFLTTVTLIDCE